MVNNSCLENQQNCYIARLTVRLEGKFYLYSALWMGHHRNVKGHAANLSAGALCPSTVKLLRHSM